MGHLPRRVRRATFYPGGCRTLHDFCKGRGIFHYKLSHKWALWVAASQLAEKVNSEPLLVAQALLPVLVLLHLSFMHSQEWLCYSTFSASCEVATHKDHL